MTPQLGVGDRVHARWRGNGDYYQATVVSLKAQEVTLAWDDGDNSDRVVDVKDVYKISEESQPYDFKTIENNSLVKELPNKGRCLFTRFQVNSGDVIFIEKPTLIAIPSKNQKLWDALKQLCDEEMFSLGTTTFHYASLLSVFTLNDADLKIIMDKFVPDEDAAEIQPEIERILSSITIPDKFPNSAQLTPALLQHLVNAWRYNSFGHHTEDGLVLYNRISMAAHGCDPSCCWTYGDEDSFVLRARVMLLAGAELTISYLQDDDLLKSTSVRRKKLENWKFPCACDRCMRRVDTCRGFRCLRCRSGAHYVIENLDKNGRPSDTVIPATVSPSNNCCEYKNTGFEQLTACDVCGERCKEAEKEQCLSLEPEYIARIDSLDKTNVADVETVYNATLDFFAENHWCVFQCEHILYEYWKEKDLALTIQHMEKKVAYHSRVYPRPTFVWAWALEELADNIQKYYKQLAEVPALKPDMSSAVPRPSRLADCINLYRKAQCQLAVLCGRAHPYTMAPQNKWHTAQSTFGELTAPTK